MKQMKPFFDGIIYMGFFCVFLMAVVTFEEALPNQIYANKGEVVQYNFDVPVTIVLNEETAEVFENVGKNLNETASYTVTCKLFGIIPVKNIEVDLVDQESVNAGGMPIGIYAKTKGVLVLDTGNVTNYEGEEICPAKNIVKSGDYLVSVNGNTISEKEQLSDLIHEYGEQDEILGVIRNGEYIEVLATPVLTSQNRFMLGIWVRDDLAGIGTLSYFTSDGNFGALGHAISDGDTREVLSMDTGYLYHTDIISIQKGVSGSPGELSGIINYMESKKLGTIFKNTPLGIYGKLNNNIAEFFPVTNTYPVGYKQSIEIGKATILSSITGENKAYEIEIEGLDFSGNEANKGIMLRVTDQELLSLTGGIIQGMSGSPIIQNGKFIGAVTHVFVNDPTRGYGIFAETMLAQQQ